MHGIDAELSIEYKLHRIDLFVVYECTSNVGVVCLMQYDDCGSVSRLLHCVRCESVFCGSELVCGVFFVVGSFLYFLRFYFTVTSQYK